MEKSIKHVEKLVHATNSALAQMKFSLMFDDMIESKNRKLPSSKGLNLNFGEKYLEGDDLQQCQDEFKLETKEMLAKIESMLSTNELHRKNLKALNRMKEINRKLNKLRPDQSNPLETQQSREKLLTLISEEKFSPRVTSSKSFHSKRQTTVESKTAEKIPTAHQSGDSVVTLKESPIRSKEEIKEKILETEEIVSRGFRTARQLAQKMEMMSKHEKKDRTPTRSDKTPSEVPLRSLEGKTESNETVSAVKCRRCLKLKKEKRNFKEVERVNAQVIEMIGNNLHRNRGPSLCMQRLPSLHIKGGLQLQKVHNLELPAGGVSSCVKENTSVRFLCHEKMENEKLEEVVQRLRKDCCSSSNSGIRGSYMECCNCGKLMKIREPPVDPQKVDEILRECNFNVFDPRIDEFVEKCGMSNFSEKSRLPEVPPTTRTPDPEPPVKEIGWKEKSELTNETEKERRRLTLQGLSDRLLKKYKKETEAIENSHLKLDRILQSLFREVDASREVFECCHFEKSEKEKMEKLSTSKPMLITLEGTSSKKWKKQRKFGKTEVIDARKCKTGSSDIGKNTFCSKKATETEGNSLIYFHSNENVFMETKEPSGGFAILNDHKPQEMEESPSQVTSTTSISGPLEHQKKKISQNLGTSCRKQKSSKTSGKEEIQRKPHGTSPLRRSREVRSEMENVSEKVLHFNCDVKKSFWPTDENVGELKTPSVIENASKENFKEEGKTLGDVFITPSSSKEGLSPLGTSSGKSEDNYESDFESTTNEPEENGDKEEEELKLSPNKLSTISEVDSNLEKKVTDEQKTSRSDQNGNKSFEMDTNDNPEKKSVTKESGIEESFPKNAPGELVTSLKDILSALRDQFTRTESLAEKLTESSKTAEKTEKTKPDSTTSGDFVLSPWKMSDGSNLVGNLLNTRKETVERSILKPIIEGSDKSEKLSTEDSLSDEGGSSLGEIKLSDRRRRRKSSGRSDSNSISESSFTKCERSAKVPSSQKEANYASDFNFVVNIEEVLYSEGEIPSEELERSEGEVLSEKNSVASSLK